jgi:inverted formin-2
MDSDSSSSTKAAEAVPRRSKPVPCPPPLPSLSASGDEQSLARIESLFGVKLAPVAHRSLSAQKPTKKMKSLFWNKIPSNETQQSPLWQAISLGSLESLPINYKTLEERFAAQDLEMKASKRRLSIADLNSYRPKSLLDSARAQNILISSGKIRCSSESLLTLLRELDPIHLTEEIVKILQNIIPTPEEIRQLRSYEGDRSLLGQAEQFLLPLCEVPRLSQRLFCHLTILTWHSAAQKLSQKLSALEQVYRDLIKEESLAHLTILLRYVLAIGNFLNEGSHRVSTAIRINSILKFHDIRSDLSSGSGGSSEAGESSRYTLLTFLVCELLKHSPDSLTYICESWTSSFSLMEGELSLSQLTLDVHHLRVSQSAVSLDLDLS